MLCWVLPGLSSLRPSSSCSSHRQWLGPCNRSSKLRTSILACVPRVEIQVRWHHRNRLLRKGHRVERKVGIGKALDRHRVFTTIIGQGARFREVGS